MPSIDPADLSLFPEVEDRFWQRLHYALDHALSADGDLARQYQLKLESASSFERLLALHDDPIDVAATLAGIVLTEDHLARYRAMAELLTPSGLEEPRRLTGPALPEPEGREIPLMSIETNVDFKLRGSGAETSDQWETIGWSEPPRQEPGLRKISRLLVGESLVGEGNEVAHIDLLIGPRGSAAEMAFANALLNQTDGLTSLLVVIAPNLPVKPPTMMLNKMPIKEPAHAIQMFGPAQRGVAKAVAEGVASGVIPMEEADDLFICVSVFIHWDAKNDQKIQEFNYQATKQAIARAVAGEPTPAYVVAQRNNVTYPFAPN